MEHKIIDAPRLRFVKASETEDPDLDEEIEDDPDADDEEAEEGESEEPEESSKAGTFTGYGSTFGNVDRQNERVIKGAYADTIEEFIQDGFIAVAHDWAALPVATVMKAAEDETGLLLSAEFHTTDVAQETRTVVRERLDRGKSVKLSIGYDVIEDRIAPDKVRDLVKLRLTEVSIVTSPANPEANVTDAKGLHGRGERRGAGLKLEGHSRMLLDDMGAWIKRLDGLLDYRAKESRTLSAQSLRDIDAAIVAIKEGLKALQTLKERATVSKGIEREFLRLQLAREAGRSFMRG